MNTVATRQIEARLPPDPAWDALQYIYIYIFIYLFINIIMHAVGRCRQGLSSKSLGLPRRPTIYVYIHLNVFIFRCACFRTFIIHSIYFKKQYIYIYII